jgi:predicted nucleic acid-binding protein
MKKLVVDSGVSVKWFIKEEYSTEARIILDEYEKGQTEFLAPDLIYSEFGNIIWKKHIFQDLPLAEADSTLADFKQISFILIPTISLFDATFQIAVKYKRTFYDSLYLALSVEEDCRFVTDDEKFYNAVRRDFPKMILLTNWQR